MKRTVRLTKISCIAAALMLANGCAMFQAGVQTRDVETPHHYDAKFDYTDLRGITESMTLSMLSGKFLQKETEPPIMMIAGVKNATEQYVDTKNLTDRMRTLLFKTGKMQFVNAARRADLLKEQGFQAAHATPETQTAIGKQLGAKFMISGTLTEMRSEQQKQVRMSKKEIRYYKWTCEVTDLTTSLLVWTEEKEFAREASKPLIGW